MALCFVSLKYSFINMIGSGDTCPLLCTWNRTADAQGGSKRAFGPAGFVLSHVYPWTECDTQLEPDILSDVTHCRGCLPITSPLLFEICHSTKKMTIALLYCLVLFIFPICWNVLEMRAAVIITASVSQVHQEFRMSDLWCYITENRFQGEKV